MGAKSFDRGLLDYFHSNILSFCHLWQEKKFINDVQMGRNGNGLLSGVETILGKKLFSYSC